MITRLAHRHRLRVIFSVLAVGLIAAAALVVPYAIHQAQAAHRPASSCLQLPAGRDPATFTAAQLQTYGLPPHLRGQSQAQWERIARHARHRVCTPDPSLHLPQASNNASCGPCWSGYRAQDANAIYGQCACPNPYIDSGFTYAATDFNVPCPDPTTLENGSVVSGWVGLGNVVKTGVAIDTVSSTPRYTAWVENTNASNPAEIPLFGVNCGDEIDAEVFDYNGVRDGFFIGDATTGWWYANAYGPNPDPNHIECIVEDYKTGSYRPDLMDFGTWTFNSCTAGDVYGQSGSIYQFGQPSAFANPLTVQGSQFSTFIMISNSRVMTMPQGITDVGLGSFTVKWYAPN